MKTQRNFILGDSWLYYKIYTGHKTSDLILTEIVKPFTKQLLMQNKIDKWFFIRYADPKHHIRLRFQYNCPEDIGGIINGLNPYLKEFVEQDIVWKVQTDMYQREIERYGLNTISLSEELFFQDSKMIVNFIDLVEGEEGEELRWLFSLRAMDSLLNLFHYDMEKKLQLLEKLKTAFGNEFRMSRPLKKQLDDKYRSERERIEEFMRFQVEDNPLYKPILDVIKTKEEKSKNIVSEILKFKKEGKLFVEQDNLLTSYLHMLMNRLFTTKNRLHEMVCYDFLYRYYKSKLAKSRALSRNGKTVYLQ